VGNDVAVIKNNKIMRHVSGVYILARVGNVPDEEMLGNVFQKSANVSNFEELLCKKMDQSNMRLYLLIVWNRGEVVNKSEDAPCLTFPVAPYHQNVADSLYSLENGTTGVPVEMPVRILPDSRRVIG
jgi:hypothetical protein